VGARRGVREERPQTTISFTRKKKARDFRQQARDGKKEAILKDKRIYVEKRPDGDFAVRRANSERASDVRPTQREAIERARELSPGTSPHVERVRNTTGGSPDKWRKA
jgi:Uncharacterized protein conserved in bacteria (DUF2188)